MDCLWYLVFIIPLSIGYICSRVGTMLMLAASVRAGEKKLEDIEDLTMRREVARMLEQK